MANTLSDEQWKEFIKELTEEKTSNLKKECQKRHIGLNTLYRKVIEFQETDSELCSKFNDMYPYRPRDIKWVDFEQLMRESILTGISQAELEAKYGIPKRTIQRKFAGIKRSNSKLYKIYQMYAYNAKRGNESSLPYNIIDEVAADYEPQTVKNRTEKLEDRRKEFVDRLSQLETEETDSKQLKSNLKNHYKEQIKRVDSSIGKEVGGR